MRQLAFHRPFKWTRTKAVFFLAVSLPSNSSQIQPRMQSNLPMLSLTHAQGCHCVLLHLQDEASSWSDCQCWVGLSAGVLHSG